MQGQEICSMLPSRLAAIVRRYDSDWENVQEIRIRQGRRMTLRYRGELHIPQGQQSDVTAMECKEILSQISQHSLYAFEEEIRRGYMTLPCGHRIGVAGRAVMERGQVRTLRQITCLNIRISHEKRGCADWLMPYLLHGKQLYSALLVSPPGGGKTTLLRDIVRNVSARFNVSLIDERSEIAGCYQGIPQRDVGPNCDVLDGCTKAVGMEMALRSLGPDVIAVDEIGLKEDDRAMHKALVSGCSLLATMHGEDLSPIREKGLFHRYILLDGSRKPGSVTGIYNQRGQQIWG